MTESLPSDFFTLESVLTLGGAAAAVLAVTNTIRKLIGWRSLWIGFVTSVVIVIVGAIASDRLSNAPQYLLAFLNSCLLFSTAFGINDSIVTLADRRPGALSPDEIAAMKQIRAKRRAEAWFSAWLAG